MRKTALLFLLLLGKMPFAEAQTITTGCPWDGTFNGTIGYDIADTNYAGETITPDISGGITQIKFWYTAWGTQSGDGTHTAVLYMSQDPGSGGATTIIDTFEFPTGLTYPDSISTYTYTFSTPYQVSAGSTYRFELKNFENGDIFMLWFDWGPSDRYAGGEGFYDGTPITSPDPSSSLQNVDQFFEYTITGTPLPVTFTGFNAYKKDKAVVLTWATISEKNNKGFEIERNTDGNTWMPIGFVESLAENGNSSGKLEYAFNDNSPAEGRNMYRLKQTGYDGRYEYSLVRMVDFGRKNSIYIYPNPSKDKVTIAGLQGNESIRIYDISGRNVRMMKAIETSASIDLCDLSEGI